jgi:hypothetical protein
MKRKNKRPIIWRYMMRKLFLVLLAAVLLMSASIAFAEEEHSPWVDKITISGAIEVEVESASVDSESEQDLVAATVELGLDVEVNEHVQGNIVLLHEEDDTPLSVDEATIIIGKTIYFKAGQYALPFGNYNSYMISDPITLDLGETCQSAAAVGYDGEWASASINLFNGDKDEESKLNGYTVDVNFHNPEETLGGIALSVGASHTYNLADSDGLEEHGEDVDGDGEADLEDDVTVAGISGYLTAEYGMFSLGLEYLAAGEFDAGELSFAVDENGTAKKATPTAYNAEVAVMPMEALQIALRVEGSTDLYDLAPKMQYGSTVSYELLEGTALSLQYLHGDYDDNLSGVEKHDVVTAQLAVEF